MASETLYKRFIAIDEGKRIEIAGGLDLLDRMKTTRTALAEFFERARKVSWPRCCDEARPRRVRDL